MERRLNDRLIEYWQRLHKDGLPKIEIFNIGPVQDIWDHCMRINVQESAVKNYYVDYMGDALAKMVGKNFTGETISPIMLKSSKFKIIKRLEDAIKIPEPLQEDGQFINEKDKVVKYRSCILPFSKDNNHITHFVIGVSWKEF